MRFNGNEIDSVEMLRDAMITLAHSVDVVLNGEEAIVGKIARKSGFVLVVYPWDQPGAGVTVSNGASREQIVEMYKSEIAQFERTRQ